MCVVAPAASPSTSGCTLCAAITSADPRQRRSQPATAAEPRRARPVEHAGREIGQRLDTAEAHRPRERRDPLGVRPTQRAPLEVVVEQPELGRRQLVVDRGRDQFSR